MSGLLSTARRHAARAAIAALLPGCVCTAMSDYDPQLLAEPHHDGGGDADVDADTNGDAEADADPSPDEDAAADAARDADADGDAGDDADAALDAAAAADAAADASADAAVEPDAAALCPDGETLCGRACRDTTQDDQHCGGCDSPCEVGRTCRKGECL